MDMQLFNNHFDIIATKVNFIIDVDKLLGNIGIFFTDV